MASDIDYFISCASQVVAFSWVKVKTLEDLSSFSPASTRNKEGIVILLHYKKGPWQKHTEGGP